MIKHLKDYLNSSEFQRIQSSFIESFDHFLSDLMHSNKEEGLYNAEWSDVGDQYLSKKNTGIRFGEYAISEDISHMHSLVVAQTGLGKTTSVTNTTLLSADGSHSYVVYDESKKIWELTSGYLKSIGYTICVFDPENPDISMQYNPIKNIKNQSDVAKASELLLSSIKSEHADKFWLSSAEMTLNTFMEAPLYLEPEKRNIPYVKELLTKFRTDPDYVDMEFSRTDNIELIDRYKYIMTIPEKTLGGVLQSIMAALRIYDLKNVKEITSDYENSFDFKTIREGEQPSVIYLFNKLQNSHYSALIGLFITQVTDYLMQREPESNERTVFYLLDEVKTLSRSIPDLPYWLSLVRKYKISMSLILQNWDSLKSSFKDDLDDVLGNTYTKCFFSGLDLDTATRLSKILGETLAEDEKGNQRIVPLYSPPEIMRMPKDQVIVLGNQSLYKFKIAPFYKQFKLNKRSKILPTYC